MTNLLDRRCLYHALREAAVQCPSCTRFFCRECVTEHAGRMICVACVSALARSNGKAARAARFRWSAAAILGILIAWLVFYYLGLTLARIPSEFHSWRMPPAVPCRHVPSEPRPQGAIFA